MGKFNGNLLTFMLCLRKYVTSLVVAVDCVCVCDSAGEGEKHRRYD